MTNPTATDEITADELRDALDRGRTTVVDALPPGAFAARHIPGAVNVTAEDDDTTVAGRLPDRDADIVVYSSDSHCNRGPELADRLRGIGYTRVRLYRDGISAWQAAGHPVGQRA